MNPQSLLNNNSSETIRKLKTERKVPLQDTIPLVIMGIILFSLTLETILQKFGFYLIVPGCLLAFISPYSSLALLSASQVIADPPGLGGLTIARMAFIGFCISCFYKGYSLRGLAPYLKTICVLFLWFIIVDFINDRHLYPPTVLAFTLGGAACLITAQKGVRWDLALFAICLGSATAAMSWWGRYLGLDITGSSNVRAGMERLAIGRLVGAAGIPCALAAVGFLGLTTWKGSVFDTKMGRSSLMAASILTATAVPQTMGRTSILGLILGFAVLLWFSIKKVRTKNKMKNINYFIYFSFCVMILLLFNPNIRSYTEKTLEFTYEQLQETEAHIPVVLGPRGWHMYKLSYLTLKYPIFGVPPGEIIVSPWGIGNKWELIGRVPHNVFLGVGYNYGIPGMILYLIFFFIPIYKLYKLPPSQQIGTLLGCHIIFFVFFMFMPFGNFKTFFVLWALENAFIIANTQMYRNLRRQHSQKRFDNFSQVQDNSPAP